MATTNPRTANSAARLKVLAEETHCALCNEPVDKTLTVQWGSHGPKCKGDGCPGCTPHPMRAEVDHIIPVAQGGLTTRDNLQLSHRRCNRTKSDGRAQPEPMPPELFPLSNCWGGIFDSLRG